MEHFLQLGRRHDAGTVMLEMRPSNKSASSLYEKPGFIGVRRNYYPADEGCEDALLLALSHHVLTCPT